MPKREQPGFASALVHHAALRRVGGGCPRRRPAPRSWASPRDGPGRCPPATCTASRSRSRRPRPCPCWSRRAGSRWCSRRRRCVPPVPVGRAAGEDLLDLPGAERVRARQLLREHRRVGGGLDALPDVAAGLLVVAVAGVQRRGEPDVDVGLRHADDPGDSAQRLVAPEELGQRRARVVEEVDRVDVEDVDRARAVMGDAVLVLAPQAELRADLGAGGVAAALAARDHDDPAADVVAVMPDAARADDAGVVVRMGPFAHHIDLHRLVGGVRSRSGPRSRPE